MPRPICREDMFEERVKAIFRKLRKAHADEESDEPFSEWVEENPEIVAVEFLNDVESYMGLPLEEGGE